MSGTKFSSRCEHCQHTEHTGPGCGTALFAVAALAFYVVAFLHVFAWTSIEHGCVVERKWDLIGPSALFSDDDVVESVVVERACPAPRRIGEQP